MTPNESRRKSIVRWRNPEFAEPQSISSCIGIALYPDHGESQLELLKNADSAMYEAKLQGRNRIQLFGSTKVGEASPL